MYKGKNPGKTKPCNLQLYDLDLAPTTLHGRRAVVEEEEENVEVVEGSTRRESGTR